MLRKWITVAVAAVVVAGGASSVAVAEPPAAKAADALPAVGHPGPKVPKTVRGTYRVIAADVSTNPVPANATIPPPLSSTTDVYREVLETKDGWLDVHLPKGHHLRPGQQVELAGLGNADSFDASSVTVLPGSTPRVDTTDVTKTLVILAYWGSKDTMTKAKAADIVFTKGNAWWKEASYGLTSLSGTVVDWVKIPNPGDCYSNGDSLMNSARTQAQGRIGSLASYERTIVYFPFCLAAAGAAGWAYVPGTRVWLNGYMDTRTSIHEQGHNYGLLHAHMYNCKSAGVRVALGGTCSSDEYGDNFDAMGGSSYVGHFSAPQKAKLGWINGKIHTYTSSGTATIAPLETSSGYKGGRIAAGGDRTYWVEYRTARGEDNDFPAGGLGVVVHMADGSVVDGGNQLLNMRPRVGSPDAVSLPLGASWTSPERIRIAFKSTNTSGAQVAVTYGAPPPSVPGAPTGVTAKSGDTAALVAWNIPDDHGDALSGYKIYYQTGTTVKFATLNSAGGAAHTTTLTGLKNSTAYTVWVRALNSQGEGPASAKVTVTPLVQVPTVTLNSPVAGATVTTDSVPLTATPTVNATSKQPISDVQFFVDGEYVGGAPSAPYTTAWEATYEKDGTHTAQAVVVDANNRVGRSAVVSFTLHKPVPGASLGVPQVDAANPNLVHVPVHATASSASATVDSVVLTYDNGQFAGAVDLPQTSDVTVDWDVRSVDNGVHTLVATVTDSTDRSTASAPGTFTVTHPTPTVTITSPGPNTQQYGNFRVVTDPQPGHTANGSAGAAVSSVEIVADSTVWLGTTDAASGWALDVLANQLAPGAHVLRARAVDGDGYVGLSAPVTVTFTPPAPTVSVASPGAGASVYGRDPSTNTPIVTQPVPSEHGATPISYVEILVDGAAYGAAAAYAPDDPNNALGTWTVQLPLASLAAGTHTLVARATDQAGYVGTSAPVDVQVLVPLPSATVTDPGGGLFTAAFSVTAAAAANATSGAAVQRVEFGLDGVTVATDTDGSDGWSANLDPNLYDNGDHALVATAVDAYGYQGPSAPVTVSFRTPGPFGSISSPGDGARIVQQSFEPLSVAGHVDTDAPDALSTVGVQVDGGTVDSQSVSGPGDVSFSNVFVNPGTHSVRLEISDASGRTRHSPRITVTVLTPPQAPYGYASGGDGKITFTWYPPSDTGGSPVSSYLLTMVDPNDAGTPLLSKTFTSADLDLTATELSYDITGQPAGVDRQVSVVARTDADRLVSEPSYPSTAAAYDATAPSPVTGVSGTGNLGGATVTWSGSASGDVTAQDVYVDAGSEGLLYGMPTTVAGSARSAVLSGLATSSDQTVTVVPRDDSGNLADGTSTTIRATTVALSRSAAAVSYGGGSTLTATVKQATGAQPLAGVAVQFLGRHKGSGAYALVATRTASSTGVAAIAVKPTRNMEYVARYPGGVNRFGRQSTAASVLVRPLVKARLSTTSVHVGNGVVIRGSVAPKHARQTVQVQRLAGGRWKTLRTVKLSATSTFSWTWKPTTRGKYVLRVVKPADADHTTGTSAGLKLAVR